MNGALLVVPAVEEGRGGGHLVRAMALVRALRETGREAWLFLNQSGEKTDALISAAGFDSFYIVRNAEWPDFNDRFSAAGKKWECIVCDRFQTPPEEFIRWEKIAPLAGIDEGGLYRNRFDFLIDILPNIERVTPNISDPSLLPLPEKSTRRTAAVPLKVLISFGQEDPAGLGPAAAKALAGKNSGGCLDITVVKGGAQYPPLSISNTLKVITNIPCLAGRLGDYDLIVTHFGITAFEALYAGVPVLLLSPTPYHEKLARTAGFLSAGIGQKKAAALIRLLFKKNSPSSSFLVSLEKRCAALAARYNLAGKQAQSLASLIDGFAPIVSRVCPVCGADIRGKTADRFADRTYSRCPACGIIGMNRINPPPVEYSRDYFFDSYQKQYGKTYIEDFPALTAMAERRLAVIKKMLPDTVPGARVLDIGCAYGPFLASAQEAGFSPLGIDPAEDAVRYVQQTLGIPAVHGFFPGCLNTAGSFPRNTGSFDIVTLWYVIEHFRDCTVVLAEIKRMLKPGGILAFATPSFSGISGRTSMNRFLKNSPADHWTIWSPRTCVKALKSAGFTVKKIVSTGHHPERFPLAGKFAPGKKSPLYIILLTVSKMFLLGDTFEVYAVRK